MEQSSFPASRRARLYVAVLLTGMLLFAAAEHVAILRMLGSFLIVEDDLRPAAAIIPLGGEGNPPWREIEAARLYRAGWAPSVIIVRSAGHHGSGDFRHVATEVRQPWEISREALASEGVPTSAIVVVNDRVENTMEELRAAFRRLRVKDRPVILVTSKYHTRRASLAWRYVAGPASPAIVRGIGQDSFDPARWWLENRVVSTVLHEYLGIVRHWAGLGVL
jgi:uncharacterized SAM-binding protein YcdF (DUF218 family)